MIDSSSISLFALVALLSGLADLLVSHLEKEKIRLLLLRGWFAIDERNPEPRLRLAANSILDVFDLIYGSRHLTWRCLRMSVVLSMSFILLLTLASSDSISSYYQVHDRGVKHAIVSSAAIAALYNVPIDYLFLLKARKILSIARHTRPIFHVLLLGADALSTVLLASCLVAVVLTIGLSTGAISPEWRSASPLNLVAQVAKESLIAPIASIHALFFGREAHGGVPVLGLSVLSTLSTSLVFAVYNAAALAVAAFAISRTRLLHLIDGIFSSKTLFTSIGLLVSGIVLIVRIFF